MYILPTLLYRTDTSQVSGLLEVKLGTFKMYCPGVYTAAIMTTEVCRHTIHIPRLEVTQTWYLRFFDLLIFATANNTMLKLYELRFLALQKIGRDQLKARVKHRHTL